MKILYLAKVLSNATYIEVSNNNPNICGQAAQKFHRLIIEGLTYNHSSITVLSAFNYFQTRLFNYHAEDNKNNVKYHYILSPKNKFLRFIWIPLYCFFYLFIWGMFDRKEKVLICDVLNVVSCMGALLAGRLLKIKCIGIMTDMPGKMVSRRKQGKYDGIINSINTFFNKMYLRYFTHYVFLSKQMNDKVNIDRKPYIVMEGLVEAKVLQTKKVRKNILSKNKDNSKIVLYAGGLHERYGLKILVEGFLQANIDNSELWLYGDGPFVENLKYYMIQDSRIKYMGICPNDIVINAEKNATLLVNPRPTNEEFTLYSFPSKNLEYMASGTPLLTTLLPSMPKEYLEYVFIFNMGETINGYSSVLKNVLSIPKNELQLKGIKAKYWVEKNKNNIIQTKRILDIIR